jgi:cysteine-rich repeat protein
MKRLILLLVLGVALFSFDSYAATCFGYDPSDAFNMDNSFAFDCDFDCEGMVPCPQATTRSECSVTGGTVGDDSFGPDPYNPTTLSYPDGTPDGFHYCTGSTISGACVNVLRDADPHVSQGDYAIGSVCVTSIYNQDCGWAEGSFMLRRGYCIESGNTAAITSSFVIDSGDYCNPDVNNFMNFISYPANLLLPGYDSDGIIEGGMCIDYCRSQFGTTSDYGKCTTNSEEASGWDSSNCPLTSYYDYCVGDTLQKYSCDGQPSIPGVSASWVDGKDVASGTEEVDCTTSGSAAQCDENCGTSSNSGYDTCIGSSTSYCQDNGPSSPDECVTASQSDLDTSENDVNDFYGECSGFEDNVQWLEGANPNTYGEYDNTVVFVNDNNDPGTFLREDFETEACGDDRDEYIITDSEGTLCCDKETDIIVLANDNIDEEPIDVPMQGLYCVDQTVGTYGENQGCGDFVVNPGSGEECDALYGSYVGPNPDGEGGFVANPNYLFLGDDDACDGNLCSPNTCLCLAEGEVCGNGRQEGSEGCDDENTEDGDGCSFPGCQLECGDGVVDSTPPYTEFCDIGTCDPGFECNSVCSECVPSGSGGVLVNSIYGECACPVGQDCSDGIGEVDVIHIIGSGSTTSTEECFLVSENVPFMGSFSIFLVFLLLVGFYFFNRKK